MPARIENSPRPFARLFLGRTQIGTSAALLPAGFIWFCDACGQEWGRAIPEPLPEEWRVHMRRCPQHGLALLYWQTAGSFLDSYITIETLDREALMHEVLALNRKEHLA